MSSQTHYYHSYENPLLTATTRSTIRDVFALSRRLGVLDIPRPLALLYEVLHLKPPDKNDRALFGGLRVWTEIGDISDSESFGAYTLRHQPESALMLVHRRSQKMCSGT